jgi:hypothetical protein
MSGISGVMICAHCQDDIREAAYIGSGWITHAGCAKAYQQALLGRAHKCPKCAGSGWEYNRDVNETETYDPADGHNGWFSPIATRVVARHEEKRCDFCEGHGYLKQKPQPIVEPAKVIGWRK